MSRTAAEWICVYLDDDTDVDLAADGTARVRLAGMRVMRRDLIGHVLFAADGTPAEIQVEDADLCGPVSGAVQRAAVNAAGRQASRARRAARAALQAHVAAAMRASREAAAKGAPDDA